jgi:serine/threonine protein kinase
MKLGRTKAIVWASGVRENYGLADTVAVKVVEYNRGQKMKDANKEIDNLKKLRHNHIVAFIGSFQWSDLMCMIMFPVATWDLEQFLVSLNVSSRLHWMNPWFGCLTKALKFLHDNNFKHRDIKPANILIDSDNSIFLTDFGVSKEYANEDESHTKGDNRFDIRYAASTLVNGDDQGFESDTFSLGCVFLEMSTVILKKYKLKDMYTFFNPTSGLDGKVEYHAVCKMKRHAQWIEKIIPLCATDFPEGQRQVWEDCLEMIERMMTECGNGKQVPLDEIWSTFHALSPGDCKSCINPVRTSLPTPCNFL